MSGIDLNRAGTGLLEIVSAPDLRSAAEAGAYMRKIHALVRYLEICDGNMQEGSFRCDANVSVRRARRDEARHAHGAQEPELVPVRRESHRDRSRAADRAHRRRRQSRAGDAALRSRSRTRRGRCAARKKRTTIATSRIPISCPSSIDDAARSRASARRCRSCPTRSASASCATTRCPPTTPACSRSQRALADYFEAVAKATKRGAEDRGELGHGRAHGRAESRRARESAPSRVSAATLAALLDKIAAGTISGKIAKEVFEALWSGEGTRRRDHREARARADLGLREHRHARRRSHRREPGAGRAVPRRQAAGARLPRRPGHEGLARQSESAAGQRSAAQASSAAADSRHERECRPSCSRTAASAARSCASKETWQQVVAAARVPARTYARCSAKASSSTRAARERPQDDAERVAATARRRAAASCC